MQKLLGALILSFMTSTAMAHGFWIDKRAGELAIVFGEWGDDASYDADVLDSIRGLDKQGKSIAISTTANKNNITVNMPKDVSAVISTYKPSYYTQDNKGEWHRKSKLEVKDAVSGTVYVQNNITLFDNQDKPMSSADELQLQIIALSDPFQLNIGDKLPVQVLFEGKPLANAKIAQDYINNPKGEFIVTDDNGKAHIVVQSTGITVLQVGHEVENQNKELSDKTYYNSTLAFNLFMHKYK